MQKPNDVRAFVHRRIISAATGFLGGGVIGAVSGFARGGGRRPSTRRGGAPIAPLPSIRAPGLRSSQRSFISRSLASPIAGPCPRGQIFRNGRCQGRGVIPVVKEFFTGPGGGENGAARFGTGAYAPTVEMRDHRSCFPGDVLGRDGFCYSKGDISNKNREYPRGRRPLGTPGEMAALSKAAAFGRRMETTVKRMQRIGVLKKPRRSVSRRPAPKLLTPGVVQIQQE